MDWRTLLNTIVTSSVTVVVVGYLAKVIIEHLFSTRVERYKDELTRAHDAALERLRNDLRATAFEHEARYERLVHLRGNETMV